MTNGSSYSMMSVRPSSSSRSFRMTTIPQLAAARQATVRHFPHTIAWRSPEYQPDPAEYLPVFARSELTVLRLLRMGCGAPHPLLIITKPQPLTPIIIRHDHGQERP